MRQEGVKWTCDRCGKEEFTEKKEEMLPNGRTIDDTPIPEGWGRTFGDEELCPGCYEKYEKLRAEFFGKKK